MKLNLESVTKNWECGQISFCGAVISRLLPVNYRGKKCTMTVKFKRPHQTGFIVVELCHPYQYWRWCIPSIEEFQKQEYFSGGNDQVDGSIENILTKQFPALKGKVWIKFS